MERGTDERRGERAMKALVVYESLWGNTEKVARAVAAGLAETAEVTVADVGALPELSADVELLVAGGPTHAFSMTRASTREDAVRQGATHEPGPVGLREWLARLPEDGPHPAVATFDTRVDKVRHLPGSAATERRTGGAAPRLSGRGCEELLRRRRRRAVAARRGGPRRHVGSRAGRSTRLISPAISRARRRAARRRRRSHGLGCRGRSSTSPWPRAGVRTRARPRAGWRSTSSPAWG